MSTNHRAFNKNLIMYPVRDTFRGLLVPDTSLAAANFRDLKGFEMSPVHAITPELLSPSQLYRCSKVFLPTRKPGAAGDVLR